MGIVRSSIAALKIAQWYKDFVGPFARHTKVSTAEWAQALKRSNITILPR